MVGFASRQCARGFLAEIRDGAQVINRLEELIHALTRKRENAVEGLAFGIDQGKERGSGKVHAGDAAVCPDHRPAGAAGVSKGKVSFLTASLANQFGFEFLQAFVLQRDFAVQRDGVGDELFKLSGHS
ncbi:MAG: hypothetical protein ACR2NX_07295 [Chthoniobacterales bacterium]